jgi:hypothetical protein
MRRIFPLFGLVILGLTHFGSRCEAYDLFAPKESNLRVFGTYLTEREKQWGGGLGLDYFFSSWAGIGLSTHLEDVEGTFFDNLASEVYLRWPIEKWHLAPYAIGSVGYEFGKQGWFQAVGGGMELRFKKKWGIFADYQYVFRHERGDESVIRAGIRIH